MRWLQSFQLLLLIGSVSGAPAWAQELPSGASVGSGLVDIATPTPGAMTINQGSPSAIVNWQGFSIGAGGSVSVVQPNAQSVMLNRVTGTATSNIAGQLNANGQVYLVNPNGIAITSSGAVNAAGFVASTLGISDSDFLAGDYRFAGDGASAGVSNAGRIDIGPGGYAALLGGRVDNSGVISAPLGKIGLGAGERVTLDLSGDGFLQVTMPSQDGGTDALISNSGTISADGGRVEISVAAAQNAARHVINLSGVVEARSVSGRSGAIVLGGSGGAVRVSGRLDTSARTPAPHPATGGVITITGAAIGLEGATLDASGLDGGGAVRIGGDYYGAGILPTAATLSVDDTSIIYADALEDGDGGGVVLWSNELTSFAGNISAKGAGAGQGGFVEVSGKHLLDYRGFADLRAASGRFGTLLLDPYNIIISAAPTSNNSGVPGYGPTGDDSNINATDLAGQLGSANVTISTAGAGAQAGNITVSAPVIWAAPTTLTLDADNTISIFNTISSGSFGGGLTLQAGGNIVLGPIDPSTALGLQAGGLFSATAGGSISGGTASAPTSITSFNDNVVLQAGGAINLVGSLSSLGGDTTATAGAALTLEGNASASNTLQLVATGSVSLLGTGHSLSSNTGLVVVSGSSFQNTGGYTVSTPFEGGRFVIYSTNWAADNNGGLTGSHLYGRTFALNPPASLGLPEDAFPWPNYFIYSDQPVLTFTTTDATRMYYDLPGALPTPSFTGLVNGDSFTDAVTGTPLASDPTTQASPVGSYAITTTGVTPTALGYVFAFVNGNRVITPAPLTITASDQSKTFGQTLVFNGSEFSASGIRGADSVNSVLLSSPGAAASAPLAGSPYAITPSGAAGTGIGNYTISYVNGVLTVTPGNAPPPPPAPEVPPVPMRSFPLGNVGDGPLPNFADLSGGIAGVRLVADAGAPAAGSPEVTKQSAQLSLQILQQRSDEFTKALEQCQLELDQSKDTTAFLNCASDALSAYGDDLDDPLIQLPPELAGTVSVIRETVQRIRTANSDSDRQAALTEARAAVRDLVDFVKKQTELVSAVDPETEAVLKQHGQVMTEALEKMDLAMVSAVEI